MVIIAEQMTERRMLPAGLLLSSVLGTLFAAISGSQLDLRKVRLVSWC